MGDGVYEWRPELEIPICSGGRVLLHFLVLKEPSRPIVIRNVRRIHEAMVGE